MPRAGARGAWRADHGGMTLLLGMALCVACAAPAAQGRLQRVHATVPYVVEGPTTVLGPDGRPNVYAVGGQTVFYLKMSSSSGGELGTMAGHCHIVAAGAQQGTWVAVCTRHYDFSDGSMMNGHSTELVGPAAKPAAERVVIAGGVGQWEGAHGEDFLNWDAAKGTGSGKITLTCLKGVC